MSLYPRDGYLYYILPFRMLPNNGGNKVLWQRFVNIWNHKWGNTYIPQGMGMYEKSYYIFL